MIALQYIILFGVYCAPFLALIIPLKAMLHNKAFYAYIAAFISVPFAFWFGIGGELHHAAAVPVLLCLMGIAITNMKFSLAWILYGLQAAIIGSILVISAYYGLASSAAVAPQYRDRPAESMPGR